MKAFEPGRHGTVPLNVSGGSGNDHFQFVYNLCQVQLGKAGHTLQDSWIKTDKTLTGKAEPKASAFWTENNAVKYSFTKPAAFNATHNNTVGASEVPIGFTLDFHSDETCKYGSYSGPFHVSLSATCSKSNLTQSLTSSGCHANYVVSTPEACGTTLPIIGAIKVISKFLGFIAIGVGLIMTFHGAKFVQFVASFLVGLGATAVVFAIGYNCLPSNVHAYVLYVVIALAIIVGVVVSKLTWKFIEEYLMSIVAAFGCVSGLLLVCGAFHLDNKYAKAGVIFFGIGFGAWVGKKLGKVVRTTGTAFIGAFMTTRGISLFVGGWPGDSDALKNQIHHSKKIWIYLATFVVLFVAGNIYQLKKYRAEYEEEA